MTVERLAELVKRTTYKPTWRMAVDGNFLRVSYHAPNSDVVEGLPVEEWPRTIEVRAIGRQHLVPPYLADGEPLWSWPNPERSALAWVKERLKSMEDHETDEWFRVDGFRLRAPHG